MPLVQTTPDTGSAETCRSAPYELREAEPPYPDSIFPPTVARVAGLSTFAGAELAGPREGGRLLRGLHSARYTAGLQTDCSVGPLSSAK